MATKIDGQNILYRSLSLVDSGRRDLVYQPVTGRRWKTELKVLRFSGVAVGILL